MTPDGAAVSSSLSHSSCKVTSLVCSHHTCDEYIPKHSPSQSERFFMSGCSWRCRDESWSVVRTCLSGQWQEPFCYPSVFWRGSPCQYPREAHWIVLRPGEMDLGGDISLHWAPHNQEVERERPTDKICQTPKLKWGQVFLCKARQMIVVIKILTLHF